MTEQRDGASFRDPSGFVFSRKGTIFRQINATYQDHYEQLVSSGLYDNLVKDDLLIPHQEVDTDPLVADASYKVIQPEALSFISYPYEWCFGQLKDAALTTLVIQKHALKFGMSLKDCSAFNVQFHHGRPIFIDTLSFERYEEGKPWDAYRQFCQHFLAPLALMSYRDIRLNQLSRIHIDGIPLDLASKLLPARTRLIPSLMMHIHLHAKAQQRFQDQPAKGISQRQVSKTSLLGLVDSLESAVKRLRWEPAGTEWADYYDIHNYSPEAFDHKEQLVDNFLDEIGPTSIWDLGANTGVFSQIAVRKGIFTVAFDIDAGAVERNYRRCVKHNDTSILPLVLDLTNPSPNLGWHYQERISLIERGPADAIMALALIHHLAFGNNLPFAHLSDFFSQLGKWLIIEFVPKKDPQAQRLLAARKDIFHDHTIESFVDVFSKRWTICRSEPIPNTHRTLFLMKRQ